MLPEDPAISPVRHETWPSNFPPASWQSYIADIAIADSSMEQHLLRDTSLAAVTTLQSISSAAWVAIANSCRYLQTVTAGLGSKVAGGKMREEPKSATASHSCPLLSEVFSFRLARHFTCCPASLTVSSLAHAVSRGYHLSSHDMKSKAFLESSRAHLPLSGSFGVWWL